MNDATKTQTPMFTLEVKGDIVTLKITLPQGRTQGELIAQCSKEIAAFVSAKSFAGKHVRLDGRLTTGMALHMGHALAHICKTVSIYDPKDDTFILAVSH